MEQIEPETQLLKSVEKLNELMGNFSNGPQIVTSKFLYNLKQIIEASKLIVETSKIITREIFLKDPIIRNQLVSLCLEIVDAYRNLEKLNKILKYNLMEETTPQVVSTSCQTIAMSSAIGWIDT